jgi:hypothetical protein
MIEARGSASFPAKAFKRIRIGSEVGQEEFDCARAFKLDMGGGVDGPHATATEQAIKPVFVRHHT